MSTVAQRFWLDPWQRVHNSNKRSNRSIYQNTFDLFNYFPFLYSQCCNADRENKSAHQDVVHTVVTVGNVTNEIKSAYLSNSSDSVK